MDDLILKELASYMEFREHLNQQFDRMNSVYQTLKLHNNLNDVPLLHLDLAEIYSLRTGSKVYYSCFIDLHHYEFSSFFSFFDILYLEFKEVLESQSNDFIELDSEFENVKEQFKIIDQMLKDKIDSMKAI
ncbi:hypothetical protein [Lysinibacillus sp. 54212]|uniref:hypothetical protein n=1 Tax=Lysinibacillus sp. 54212 TaxID=3119829 RepID=UPI002FC5B94E